MTAKGSRKRVRGIADLAGGGVWFANRNPGSGTRVWLDAQLRALRIPPDSIDGYDVEWRTHSEVALAVSSGHADAGLGVRAAAERSGLDFTPLFTERYDLVFSADRAEEEPFARIRDRLDSRAFHREVRRLGGYNADHTGDGTRLAG
jgi:putative molybdopterin biosynthesis protein